MELLREYLLRIIGMAMLSGLVMHLCPSGSVKRIVRLCCGMCLALVVLSPLQKTDVGALMRQFEDLETEAADFTDDAMQYLSEQTAAIISQQSEAYILDKAPAGAVLAVQVQTLPLENGYCVPHHVTISGSLSAQERISLTQIIQRDFGLTKEQIEWK